MFTQMEKEALIQAIEMAIASQKRAQNSNKNPKFLPVYAQIQRDLEGIKAKVQDIVPIAEKPSK